MVTPAEKAAEGPADGGRSATEPADGGNGDAQAADSCGDDAEPADGSSGDAELGDDGDRGDGGGDAEPGDGGAGLAAALCADAPAGDTEVSPSGAGQRAPRPRNRAATTSLIAGILGVTGVGAILGVGFGLFGLAHAGRLGGRVRCWVGIVLSLLWLGGIVYVAPYVIKAADPGCTAFKEKALPRYDTAIGDLNRQAGRITAQADLGRAITSLRAAAGDSQSEQPRAALQNLAGELARARADTGSGQVPGSVMQALNHDAVVADNACGTI
jgi:hypothetical protein